MPKAQPKTCPLCKRHFPTRTLFKRHILATSRDWPVTCCHEIRENPAHRCSRCDQTLSKLARVTATFLHEHGARGA